MTYKNRVLLGAIFLLTAASAAAADWAGFYTGANVGYGLGTSKAKTSTVFSPTGYFATTSVPAIETAGDQTVHPKGFGLAGVLGYNWVSGNNVYGVEGDLGYFGLKGDTTKGATYPCCAPTAFTVKSEVKTSWLATARGRYGWTSNNWLYYVTGGLAVTDLKGKFTFNDTFATAAESAEVSKTKMGWTIGAGGQFAWQGPWALKFEYLYADFGKASVTSNNLTAFTPSIAFPTNTFTHSVDLKVHILRAGVTYKF